MNYPTASHVLANRISRVDPTARHESPNRISRVTPNRTSRVNHTSGAVEALIFSTDLESFRFDFCSADKQRHLHLVAPTALTGKAGWLLVAVEPKKNPTASGVRYES